MNRKIRIIGDIDHDAYRRFSRRMDILEEISDEEIHIVLMSDGGDGQCALAFYDRIRMSRCRVSVTGIGLVASAAALILVAPKSVEDRTMTQNAWLMVHDDSLSEIEDQRVSQIEKTLKQSKAFEEQWNRLMSINSRASISEWMRLHEDETYLTPEMCLSLGVIGGII